MTIEQATEADFAELNAWRYEPPYDFYDGDVDPVKNPERHFVARDDDGALVGFYYFEVKGDVLEYGLGLRPDLTGRSLGLDFFRAGLEFGARALPAGAIRLYVAAFNERAIKVYERAGFRETGRHVRRFARWGDVEFVNMDEHGDRHLAGGARGEGRRRARDDARRARLPARRGRRGRARSGAARPRGRRRAGDDRRARRRASGSGSTEDELARFDAAARKVGPRDLAAAVVQRAVGATTVGGTLAVVPRRRDRASWRPAGSAASTAAGRTLRTSRPTSASSRGRRSLVVSAGIKSLLDVPATLELLETLAVPVLGYRIDTLPLFYAAAGGPPRLGARRDAGRGGRGRAGALGARRRRPRSLARPPDESLDDVEPLIGAALAERARRRA